MNQKVLACEFRVCLKKGEKKIVTAPKKTRAHTSRTQKCIIIITIIIMIRTEKMWNETKAKNVLCVIVARCRWVKMAQRASIICERTTWNEQKKSSVGNYFLNFFFSFPFIHVGFFLLPTLTLCAPLPNAQCQDKNSGDDDDEASAVSTFQMSVGRCTRCHEHMQRWISFREWETSDRCNSSGQFHSPRSTRHIVWKPSRAHFLSFLFFIPFPLAVSYIRHSIATWNRFKFKWECVRVSECECLSVQFSWR